MDTETKRYIDAKVEAVSAKNDARFTEVLSELKGLREDGITWKQLWGAAVATTVAVAGLTLAALAIGGDRFDGGMAAGVVLEESRKNAVEIQNLLAAQERINASQDERLDRVIKALEGQAAN